MSHVLYNQQGKVRASQAGRASMEANTPNEGFGFQQVPVMPGYVAYYTKRGAGTGSTMNETVPVMHRTRMGQPKYLGGVESKVLSSTNKEFFDALGEPHRRSKRGLTEIRQQNNPSDNRQSISAKNQGNRHALHTRGGRLRKGGPKNQDYMSMDKSFYGTHQYRPMNEPGNRHSMKTMMERHQPDLIRGIDHFKMMPMIEENPFHIRSFAAKQNKDKYEEALGGEPQTIRGRPFYYPRWEKEQINPDTTTYLYNEPSELDRLFAETAVKQN